MAGRSSPHDHAATSFQAMTAKVKYLTHTDVLDENSEESGTLTMRKAGAREAEGLIDLPDPPSGRGLRKAPGPDLLSKINTVNVYDLGKHGEQLDQFLMTGFGTSGIELAHNFDVKRSAPKLFKNNELSSCNWCRKPGCQTVCKEDGTVDPGDR